MGRYTEIGDIFVAPTFFLQDIENAFLKYGKERVLKDRDFQKLRERWVVSVVSLCFTNDSGIQHYILKEKREEDTPDVYVYNFALDERGRRHAFPIPIEVVEWTSFSGTPFDVIKKKCETPYPKNFTLVCYNRNPDKSFVPENLYNQLKSIPYVPFRDIYILSSLKDKHILFRIYPSLLLLELNHAQIEEMKQSYEHYFLKYEGRGTSGKLNPLGTLFLPFS